MRNTTEILNYLMGTYLPVTIIVYGSYANGTAGESSDFDALVVVREGEERHDTAVIDGVPLDVFVYPVSYFDSFDPESVLQIYGGNAVLDNSSGFGEKLLMTVSEYVESKKKSGEEIWEEIEWCKKMLLRITGEGAEPLFRRCHLLTESLQIAADVYGFPYLGSKKCIKMLEEKYPAAYQVYHSALKMNDPMRLTIWVSFLSEEAKRELWK